MEFWNTRALKVANFVEKRMLHPIIRRAQRSLADESGMSTVEYALGTIAAAAFGAVLYTVVTGGSIVDALTSIIERALNTSV